MDKILELVTDDMNKDLVRVIYEEKVIEVVFQLGAFKTLGPDGFNGFFIKNSRVLLKMMW